MRIIIVPNTVLFLGLKQLSHVMDLEQSHVSGIHSINGIYYGVILSSRMIMVFFSVVPVLLFLSWKYMTSTYTS